MTLRQGSSIRKAAAGLERLLLSDEERVAHCDGSALLVGYLLGLPCFCYRPDVVEAVKLLRESPDSLDAFKQPAAATASARRRSATTSSSSFMKMIRGDKSESSLSMVQRGKVVVVVVVVVVVCMHVYKSRRSLDNDYLQR